MALRTFTSVLGDIGVGVICIPLESILTCVPGVPQVPLATRREKENAPHEDSAAWLLRHRPARSCARGRAARAQAAGQPAESAAPSRRARSRAAAFGAPPSRWPPKRLAASRLATTRSD